MLKKTNRLRTSLLNILVIMGTRPEAIKMAPIIEAFRRRRSRFNLRICFTAQHRQMLDQVAQLFEITPDYDLNIMSGGQDLFGITSRVLDGLKPVMEKERPDLVLVQGDTTTTMAAALAAFYLKIPVGHVEAGLRTYDKTQPFPEEINRHLTSVMSDFHFAPTPWAEKNLIGERIPREKIWITGNPVVDALLKITAGFRKKAARESMDRYFQERWNLNLAGGGKGGDRLNRPRIILITGHRRESFGPGFRDICQAIGMIARRNPQVLMIYPVHLNPNVRRPVFELLGSGADRPTNIRLIDPLDYLAFIYLMEQSDLILTDSGGIQEEAPSLGKPVLIMRNTTERPEGIKAGCARLVGTDPKKILTTVETLLKNDRVYKAMASVPNPYGDGKAASRIVQIIDQNL